MIYGLVREGGWGSDIHLFQCDGFVPDDDEVATKLGVNVEGDNFHVSPVETDLKDIPKI
jgi:hypothetical protein